MKYKKIFISFLLICMICGSAAAYAYYSWMEAKFPHNNNVPVTKVIGNEPVNYLIMGSDSRGEKNARADTLVIYRIDPKHKLTYLISIPRDLKVDIPGHGNTKINAATAFGGPELMIKTLKQFTGFDINHYALINFKGFRQIINSLGGIEVNVEKPINSNEPGYKMHIKKGRQVLNGTEALNYVRFRHDAEGDIGRIKRQQQFFKALSDELLSLRTIPKIPNLVSTFADNTQTDMSSSEMANLAWALRSLDKKKMQTVMLPGSDAYINGVSYLLPENQKIKSILSDIKHGKKIDTEKPLIKIEVLNGSGVPGKALTVKNMLLDKGFNVLLVSTSANKNKGPIVVYCRPKDKNKAKKVSSAIPGSVVKVSTDIFKSIYIDVIVVTGKSS
jgi:LCP family protein required for cell wall assembly